MEKTKDPSLSLKLKALLPELNNLLNKAREKITKEEEVSLERTTESILIEPFLKIFGYASSGIESNRFAAGFKIGKNTADFALFKDHKMVIVVEAKRIGADIKKFYQQLSDYFNTTEKENIPKFGILTNGQLYEFYASSGNRMDTSPCFTFNLSLDCENVNKLSKLSELLLNINEEVAKNEKTYTNLRNFIESRFKPSDDPKNNQATEQFVRNGIIETAKDHAVPLHEGVKIMATDVEKIKKLTFQVFKDIIDDNVNQRIDLLKQQQPFAATESKEENKIEFTEEERLALLIVRGIAAEIEGLDIHKIVEDDYQGHCNIILGPAKRSKICTLYFNNPNKLFFAVNNVEYPLSNPNDIYKFKNEIKTAIKNLMEGKPVAERKVDQP